MRRSGTAASYRYRRSSSSMNAVRTAIGDNDAQRFIRSAARGFRFVARSSEQSPGKSARRRCIRRRVRPTRAPTLRKPAPVTTRAGTVRAALTFAAGAPRRRRCGNAAFTCGAIGRIGPLPRSATKFDAVCRSSTTNHEILPTARGGSKALRQAEGNSMWPTAQRLRRRTRGRVTGCFAKFSDRARSTQPAPTSSGGAVHPLPAPRDLQTEP